jgi:hypothetical protein
VHRLQRRLFIGKLFEPLVDAQVEIIAQLDPPRLAIRLV